MNLIKKYINYLHLKKESFVDVDIASYTKAPRLDLAERHLSYLKELYDYQRERQTSIESKNSQLVGQASVIVSITALFVPLFIDKLTNLGLVYFSILIFGFVFVLFHYLIAIIHAIKTLQINHYKYSTRKTSTVTRVNRASAQSDFIKEEIEDLIWSIDKNTVQNNRKGRNLIYATRSFRIATIGLAIFTLLIIFFSMTVSISKDVIDVNIRNEKLKIETNCCDLISNDSLEFDNLYFEFNETGILPASSFHINNIISLLHENELLQLEIIGNTDSVGSVKYNEVLSLERAESVAKELIKNGVSKDRIVIMGFGENYPIMPNSSYIGRWKNRRVEIKIKLPNKT